MSDTPPDASTEQRDPLIGRAIAGRFLIERRLGAGAMGAVYRAQQVALDRPVAVKVMRGELAADATYAERFQREAKAASRIDHPNVVRVHDHGQEPDGLLYIAMEYLDCRDLSTLLAEEWPLPLERIVDILSQMLSGLAEAHDAGVLHRDLNPKNIMILRRKAEDGSAIDVVKVCDFGIAKLVEPADRSKSGGATERRKLTTAGLVIGTPDYMSPEQARGESYDARSDLYAVGVILYQLLTRHLPFEAKSPVELVFKAMHAEPRDLDSHGTTAAPLLDPICVKAIRRRPEDRYQSAREMRAALQAARAGGEGARRSAARGSKASGGVLGAVLGAFLVASGVIALFVEERAPVRTPPTTAPAPRLAVEEAPASAPAAPPAPDEPAPPPPPRPRQAPVATSSPPARDPSASPERSLAAEVPSTSAYAPPPTVPPSPSAFGVTPPAPSGTVPGPPPAPRQAARSFDVRTARVELASVKSNNAAVTSGSVSRALGPIAARFTACYRSALAEGAGAASSDIATLHLESDDEGYVAVARLDGVSSVSLARCIEAVSRDVHLDVDTGSANADATLLFRPR